MFLYVSVKQLFRLNVQIVFLKLYNTNISICIIIELWEIVSKQMYMVLVQTVHNISTICMRTPSTKSVIFPASLLENTRTPGFKSVVCQSDVWYVLTQPNYTKSFRG